MKAFGVCAESGKSWSHKDEQQELEGVSKLGPTVPAGSGCRTRARLNKEQAQPNALPAPTGNVGNVPTERPGRQPKGTLLPGRRQGARGSKLPHKDTRGRGGGTFLTNPPQLQRGWGGGNGLSLHCLGSHRARQVGRFRLPARISSHSRPLFPQHNAHAVQSRARPVCLVGGTSYWSKWTNMEQEADFKHSSNNDQFGDSQQSLQTSAGDPESASSA